MEKVMATASNARRMVIGIAGLVGAVLALCSPASAQGLLDKVKAKGKLVVGTEAALPPMEFVKDGKIVGYGKDILDLIVKDMGVQLEQLDLPWQGILPGLAAGKFDFVATTVNVTPQRAAQYAFTMPIAEGTPSVVKRRGDKSIMTLDDLRNKIVAAQLGSANVDSAKAWDEKLKATGAGFKELKLYTSITEANLAVANRTVDVVIASLPTMALLVKERPTIYELVGPIGDKRYIGWVTRPEDKDFRDFLNQQLRKLRDSGKLAELQDKWLGFRVELPDSGYLPPGAL
jgi:polar amino acid transport system substrate-binding protein